MPFDTRITILIQAEGHRNEFGEYVEGVTTEYPRWADESGAGSADLAASGGLFLTSVRTFLVRWFRELAVAPETFVDVRDNLDQQWHSESISLSDARKRFIVISAARVPGEGEEEEEDPFS